MRQIKNRADRQKIEFARLSDYYPAFFENDPSHLRPFGIWPVFIGTTSTNKEFGMRIQLALNVKDLNKAIEYYSKMFDVVPHKVRDGYANFSIDKPPLKLVLFENHNAIGDLNHLGVELFDSEEIDIQSQRLSNAGILQDVQMSSICCHAEQDKVWTKDDQNIGWEWYLIKDDNPSYVDQNQSECCRDITTQDTSCC